MILRYSFWLLLWGPIMKQNNWLINLKNSHNKYKHIIRTMWFECSSVNLDLQIYFEYFILEKVFQADKKFQRGTKSHGQIIYGSD